MCLQSLVFCFSSFECVDCFVEFMSQLPWCSHALMSFECKLFCSWFFVQIMICAVFKHMLQIKLSFLRWRLATMMSALQAPKKVTSSILFQLEKGLAITDQENPMKIIIQQPMKVAYKNISDNTKNKKKYKTPKQKLVLADGCDLGTRERDAMAYLELKNLNLVKLPLKDMMALHKESDNSTLRRAIRIVTAMLHINGSTANERKYQLELFYLDVKTLKLQLEDDGEDMRMWMDTYSAFTMAAKHRMEEA
jgi:hypothetical protein